MLLGMHNRLTRHSGNTATKEARMKRRGFLGGAAVGGAAAAVSSFPAPAIAQGKAEWRMVTTWPKNYPGQGTAAERFAKTIGEATDARLTIQVYGAGEL